MKSFKEYFSAVLSSLSSNHSVPSYNTKRAIHIGVSLTFCLMAELMTILVLVVHYNTSFTETLDLSNYILFNTILILASFIIINVSYSNLLAYIKQSSLYSSVMELLNVFLVVIEHIGNHIYRIIISSIKFRIKIGIIMLSLYLLNMDNNIIYYTVVGYISFLFTVGIYKSNNKSQFVFRLLINLIVIYTFWHNIADYLNISIIILFMHNNMLFMFGEWDFDFEVDLSEALNNINLHGYSIGDPLAPPMPPKFKPLIMDNDSNSDNDIDNLDSRSSVAKEFELKYRDPNDYRSWAMNMPNHDNYKDFIIFKGVKYSTDTIKQAYKFKPVIKEGDFPVRKGFIIHYEDKYFDKWTFRDGRISIAEHQNSLPLELYRANFQLNTLLKAKTYYDNTKLGLQGKTLDVSFKESAEGWQKRQISSLGHRFANICKVYDENPEDLRNVTFPDPNHFDDEVAYNTVRKDLHGVKLVIIQLDNVIEATKGTDFSNMSTSEYDSIIDNLNKKCSNKYKDAFETRKLCNAWETKNLQNKVVDDVFRNLVGQMYYLHKNNIKMP